MRWLKAKLRCWLGIDGENGMEARLKDVERQFATKRNAQGKVLETLADVPMHERKERVQRLRGMSMEQRRAWLEATDGGRQMPTDA